MSRGKPFFYGREEELKKAYLDGMCAQEMKDVLNLPVSTRAIQRFIKLMGITRSDSEHRLLSAKRGRMIYPKYPVKVKRKGLPKGVRFMVLARDNFRCVLCGADAKTTLLQVDHKDQDKNNHALTNLQTLCTDCNSGKFRVSEL